MTIGKQKRLTTHVTIQLCEEYPQLYMSYIWVLTHLDMSEKQKWSPKSNEIIVIVSTKNSHVPRIRRFHPHSKLLMFSHCIPTVAG